MMETEMDEVLVLSDEDGTYYVVPRATLERYQVADDQKAAIDALLGEEVVGYLMGQSTYVTEQLVSTYQAEKRHEGAQERLVHAALHPTTDESAAGAAPPRWACRAAWSRDSFAWGGRRSRVPQRQNPKGAQSWGDPALPTLRFVSGAAVVEG
jgi:hypothetical protein